MRISPRRTGRAALTRKPGVRMSNIHDYLLWRGDLSLSERPFNDVDNIILSALLYIDFTGTIPSEETGRRISLRNACLHQIAWGGGDVTPFVHAPAKVDTRFVRLLAESKRFGPAQLCAYEDVVDPVNSLQFAALQIDLPNGETYVSYRGSDSTLVSWREDFMLSFTVTQAQRMAAAYLGRVLDRTQEEGRTIRVGGHSKGGNLAEYAAICCTDEQLKRIVRVYSNDGPRMAPEVVPHSNHAALGSRFKHIVPTYSVIGMLFAPPDDPYVVVKSTGTGIGQHELTTWQVLNTGIDEAVELQPDCVVLNNVIARWADGIPLDERERVTNEVFDALEAGGATRFEEIASSTSGLQQVLSALSSTDERTQELALALVDGAVGTSMSSARKATRETLEQWRQGAQSVADEAARLLQAGSKDIRVPLSSLRANRRRLR